MIALVPLFGAFEVMIPLHLLAMPAGMTGAMFPEGASGLLIVFAGFAWGVFVYFMISYCNSRYQAGDDEESISK